MCLEPLCCERFLACRLQCIDFFPLFLSISLALGFLFDSRVHRNMVICNPSDIFHDCDQIDWGFYYNYILGREGERSYGKKSIYSELQDIDPIKSPFCGSRRGPDPLS